MKCLSSLLRSCLLAGLLALITPRLYAQAPLFLVDDDTKVSGISFKFVDSQTFEENILKRQMATAEPGFFDKIKRILPILKANVYPFDPIELQKDVARLRRFYNQNGYIYPTIRYSASQLDTTSNAIRVILTIEEGPPLIIQDVGFYAPDSGYLASAFQSPMRERWIRFRDRTSFQVGDRYTEFERLRIQDEALNWMQNQGFAFAQFDTTSVVVDSTALTVDLGFYVDPGPRGYFDDILVEGNESVGRDVVLREVPFETGDRFTNRQLVEGQRELFSLNLFRVALADVPPACGAVGPDVDSLRALAGVDPTANECQPKDETVTVRYRVREAEPRYIAAQTGFDLETGLLLESDWTHRNFFGGARTLTVSAVANTGLGGTGTGELPPPVLLRGAVSLRQPYLLSTKASGTIAPFFQYERDPLLRNEQSLGRGFIRDVDLNRREFGVNASVLYQFYPFRNLALQYTFSRVSQIGTPIDVTGIPPEELPDDINEPDPFSRSVLTLSGTFGNVDDFLRPRNGFLLRPFLEQAGLLLPAGIETVEYYKAGNELVAYWRISDNLDRPVSLAGRLFLGQLWPRGRGAGNAQFEDPVIEDRYDPVRFYSGGANDVRGWALNLLGPQRNLTQFRRDSTGAIVFDADGDPELRTTTTAWEPVGGEAKLAGNIELRLPFPGLGSRWRTAVFLDFGQVSSRRVDDPSTMADSTNVFEDNGKLFTNLKDLRFGTGGGIRYETPIGYLRLDLAYKINPPLEDLQRPEDAFLYEHGFIDDPRRRFLKRFNLHFSIGQAF